MSIYLKQKYLIITLVPKLLFGNAIVSEVVLRSEAELHKPRVLGAKRKLRNEM